MVFGGISISTVGADTLEVALIGISPPASTSMNLSPESSEFTEDLTDGSSIKEEVFDVIPTDISTSLVNLDIAFNEVGIDSSNVVIGTSFSILFCRCFGASFNRFKAVSTSANNSASSVVSSF